MKHSLQTALFLAIPFLAATPPAHGAGAGGGPACAARSAAAPVSPEAAPSPAAKSPDWAVHEWGTFTSVARANGEILTWDALGISAPLPRFVHRNPDLRKGEGQGTVRMETPVIYFHGAVPASVDVEVSFPKGKMTEWYPAAAGGGRALAWKGLTFDPAMQAILPTELAGSHYYAARGVAAVPLASAAGADAEHEKFLFYRGAGSFELPISARLEGRRVIVASRSAERISQVMLFERRGDQFGYSIHCYLDGAGEEATFDRDQLRTSEGSLGLDDLKKILRGEGLREDEAQAMVDTWREDWFEEGLRVLYTVPRSFTERVLPLSIRPAPSELRRVFLGRLELLPAEHEAEILAEARALGEAQARGETLDARLDGLVLRFGRFAAPILTSTEVPEGPGRSGAWLWVTRLSRGV